MSSHDSVTSLPHPVNEPVRAYLPGDPHRASLKSKLESMAKECIEIPCVIDGKEVKTSDKRKVVQPHSHSEVLGEFYYAGERELKSAVAAAQRAKPAWEAMPWQERAGIFLKAADLLAGPYRDTINSATMLGQSKTVLQSEADAACELIDFLRFNAHWYQKILTDQPISPNGFWNRMDYRPLEGFVVAITPFNFTAIAGNLCATPAMLGNTVVWKPSDTQMLSAHYTMKVFREAGLPDGVINLVSADGPKAGAAWLEDPLLGGVHFTGSSATFRHIWKTVGSHVENYRSYPRVVGETGGKDFVFAHPTANVEALVVALIRGAFEYQGQKCSAASRAYIPKSLWPEVQERLIAQLKNVKMGDVRDFRNFMSAVIDERAFNKISGFVEGIKSSSDTKIIFGGNCNKAKGYFIEPTVAVTTNPKAKTMVEEIFGPVLTLYVYEDNKLAETLKLCDETSPYSLTGALFSQDRYALNEMSAVLRHSAGNLYLNDKCTGAVVGQQPFGGARASGTNDKAGSVLNLYRWLSPRVIKEAFVPAQGLNYHCQAQD